MSESDLCQGGEPRRRPKPFSRYAERAAKPEPTLEQVRTVIAAVYRAIACEKAARIEERRGNTSKMGELFNIAAIEHRRKRITLEEIGWMLNRESNEEF